MGGYFDINSVKNKITSLEEIISKENFWDNIDYANEITKQLSDLKKQISAFERVSSNLLEIKEMINLSDDDLGYSEELSSIANEIESLKIKTLLNGKYDELNCYLEIHPGAGGTESCDWAEMLKRMYLRFCENNNYSYEIIDEQKGEEAGIKSITILIKGDCAYGYFKSEKGVHRLVRISPFDSNKRRHTSFASVEVTPVFSNIQEVEIKESELKIDVYHSSGAGGQSVNTSDSAVRITHLPTKTVVSCQVERSQLMNKERALAMLKGKLLELEIINQEKEIKDIKGNLSDINFGSQIRNYVLEPYTLVKDTRTGYETSEAFKVLDGNIKNFMIEFLKK